MISLTVTKTSYFGLQHLLGVIFIGLKPQLELQNFQLIVTKHAKNPYFQFQKQYKQTPFHYKIHAHKDNLNTI